MKIPKEALTSPDRFAAEIRKRIEQGELASGVKLPNTMEWAKALKVDHRLLQAGLGKLASQGFLERKPRVGTLVREPIRKPCILVLLGWPTLPGRTTFHSTLFAKLKNEVAANGYRMEVFDNAFELLSDSSATREEAVADLRETIERLNPAGYIQVEFDLNRISELYPKYKRPTVSYGSMGSRFRVGWDSTDIFSSALKYLEGKGRRKLLFLRHQRRINPVVDLEFFWSEVRKNKFLRAEIREIFDSDDQSGDYEARMEANTYRLMKETIADWKTRRKNYIPDCLLVNDDVMMKGVALALIEARISVPDDLLIVVRSTSEIERHYPIPVVKYVMRIEDAARSVVEMLDGKITRRGSIEAPRLLKGCIEAG